MIFVFDNNLPPALAHGVKELSSARYQHEIIHLTDRFPANTPDSVWIEDFSEEKNQVVIITQDKLTKANEAILLRNSGLMVFHLEHGWSTHNYWDNAQNLVRWWPFIVDQAQRISGAAAFRVKWSFNKKFEQVRLK